MPTYTKVHTDWQDLPSTATPITAAALETIEEGIFQASRAASQTQDGNVELATPAEMTTGTDTTRVPAVKTVVDWVNAQNFGSGSGTVGPDLTAIENLAPVNDDIIQRKSGAWTNRTMAQLKVDLGINNVTNTSDATKWDTTKTLTNTTLDFDFDTTGNAVDNIPMASVVGLESALNGITSPTGIMRYVKYNSGTSSYPNRSSSGTIDPTIPVVWMEGPGPAISGTGSTGAVASVDYWWRTA